MPVTQLSLDEFLDLDADRYELLGGQPKPKPLPTLEHGWMEQRLIEALKPFYGRRRVVAEVSLRLGDESPIPDVIVLRSDNPPRYRTAVAEPPLLCVEVLSPSQRLEEIFLKCRRYKAFGVSFCWVIDPESRRAWELSGLDDFEEVTESFSTPGPEGLRLAALFE
jgi:Uma2 family endonuclease